MQKRVGILCAVTAVAAGILINAGVARATNFVATFSAASPGDWGTAANWSGGVIPTTPANATGPNGCNALIQSVVPNVSDIRWANGGNSVASISVVNGGSLTVDNSGIGFTIGRSNGATGTVNMSGGSITTLSNGTSVGSGVFSIGDLTNGTGSATGVFNFSGGNVAVGTDYSIGTASNLAPNGGGSVHNPPTSWTHGNVTQTGGDAAVAGAVDIGLGGIATYTMSAGSIEQNGTNPSSSSLGRSAFFVARNAYSQGTFSQSGTAAVTIADGMYIADNNGATGSYTISGGTLSMAGELRVAASMSDAGTAITGNTGLLSIIGSTASPITANSLMADTAGSTLNFSIDSSIGTTALTLVPGSAGGVTYTGNAIFSSATNIDVDNISGFVPAQGESFTLLTADGGINTLPTLVNDSDAFDNATLSIVNNTDGSSSLVVTTFVPEPANFAVLAMASLAAVRRRK